MSNTPSHLENLNPQQLEAVKHHQGPILVLAGAGSGKTRVLTHRIVNLITQHNIAPHAILAVTFTNKATDEMRERLKGLLGNAAEQLWISTFHAAGLRMLRRHADRLNYKNNFAVYDPQDVKALLRQILKELSIDEKKHSWSSFARVIDSAKNSLILPEEFAQGRSDFIGELQSQVYETYQRKLLESNAMDFGDLLVNSVLLLEKFPEIKKLYQERLSHILVDEFQDTNQVQYRLIRHLSAPQDNLLVVGDDDQSIYAFRGANIANILNFENDFPGTKVVKLEQNYRSTENILTAAQAVIEKNGSRKEKQLWTEEGGGPPISVYIGYSESDEANYVTEAISEFSEIGIPLSDIAIFYRTNAQSRALEESLLNRGLPYRIYGGLKFYERKEVKDIMSYLRMIINEGDAQAFFRTINTPPRGIGAQSVKKLALLASNAGCSLYQAAKDLGSSNKKLGAYVSLVESLKAFAKDRQLHEVIAEVVDKTGYRKRLEESTDPTAQSRLENLQELIGLAVTSNETLEAFLDRATLTTAGDTAKSKNAEATHEGTVSLMTLHLAKGLEFPVVFLTGFEEGLLPHHMSSQSKADIEEERRLCYVGMTRAMRNLHITRAQKRGMFSSSEGFGVAGYYRQVSRFSHDIPQSCIDDKSGGMFFVNEGLEDEVIEQDGYDFEEEEQPKIIKRKKGSKKIGLADLKTADEL